VAPAEGEATTPPMTLPPRLRVHLVPAARERADDPLAFHESAVNPDGSFALNNVAPGRYLIITRTTAASPDASEFNPHRPAAWDADARAALRREAEASGAAVELTTCQRVTDYTLRFPQRTSRQ
jgi:hypothetical protein